MKQHEVWLKKAVNDHLSAVKLSEGDKPILDTAIYHTQQCAEKAFKAFLVFNGRTVRKIHDLNVLLNECITINKDFATLRDHVIILNPYSAVFRYPGDIIEPEYEDVEEAIFSSEKILKFIENLIKN